MSTVYHGMKNIHARNLTNLTRQNNTPNSRLASYGKLKLNENSSQHVPHTYRYTVHAIIKHNILKLAQQQANRKDVGWKAVARCCRRNEDFVRAKKLTPSQIVETKREPRYDQLNWGD
jgi:hypothetical protein